MNKLLATCLLVVAVGCGKKTEEARIKRLEEKVATLEERSRLFEAQGELLMTNLAGIAEIGNKWGTNLQQLWALETSRAEQDDGLRQMVTAYFDSITNAAAKPKKPSKFLDPSELPAKFPTYSAVSAPDTDAPSGIPSSVYAEIQSSARKQWPNDYEMQVYTVKNQMTAYLKLHPR